MAIRILLAIPTEECLRLLHSLLDEALNLICFDLVTAEVRTHETLFDRIDAGLQREADAVMIAGRRGPATLGQPLLHRAGPVKIEQLPHAASALRIRR